MAVEVVHWNPSRRVLPGLVGKLIPIRRPVNNFGDLLGPVIVDEMVARQSLTPPARDRRLVSVGSIMRMARDGDVVWGTGVNGKTMSEPFTATKLDVRAVRGPLTRAFLAEQGIKSPAVYGDPGLLVGHLWDRREVARGVAEVDHVVIPNLHDHARVQHRSDVIDPTAPLWEVVKRIAAADFVVGSSLHGVIVAESFGIRARLVRSSTEPLFKYEDYYRGTGRETFGVAESVDEALSMGGESLPDWDPAPLMAAFPSDLWVGGE
ncbi:polysaccharide pyruvyl transferase family protein [Herbiconiux flava]|uniref:Pyruvyl transferase n=1 Tax=Herbiconiux flava TaxID=881268 RepID=A0A852S9H3_9MICO|nr:polysaccharide pyruvyl transferase family protein [Herbiconiux flava]NYD68886.1 pyruvyl transferase [Herbiconiux flava]GLK15628.1 GumL protein [Herbiconiux flava]